jgi:hypothetical protein
MVGAPGQAVELHTGDHVHLTRAHGGQERVEGRPVLLGSRHPLVDELGKLPAASRGEGAEGGQLVLGSLL